MCVKESERETERQLAVVENISITRIGTADSPTMHLIPVFHFNGYECVMFKLIYLN